jgi:hypothetical protein
VDFDAVVEAERTPGAQKQPFNYSLVGELIEQVADMNINIFGDDVRFKDVLNIPMRNLATEIASMQPRSNVILSAEQTNKTMTEVAIVKAASMMGKPSIILVKDIKRNVTNLCETKVDTILNQMGVKAVNLASRKEFLKFTRSAKSVKSFREGTTTLVIQTLYQNLKDLNDKIIFPHNIDDMVVVLDESDAIWSSKVSPEQRDWNRTTMTSREFEMYRFLVGVDEDGRGHKTLCGNNRIRNLFSVSATHMATLEWHSMWGTPYNAHVVDLDGLKERGYATYDCLSTLKDGCGFDIYLDPSDQTARGDYNMHSSAVKRMIGAFHADSMHPTKKGQLLMIAMSPRINAGGMNAHRIIDHVLVELAKLRETGPGPSSVAAAKPRPNPLGLVFSHGGPHLVELKLNEDGKAYTISRRLKVKSRNSQGRERLAELEDPIDWIDKKFGIETPLVITGYNYLTRGRSYRSKNRVITDIMVGPTRGMAAANVQQMTMRCGGHTVAVRAANGFDRIRALMIEEDLMIVRHLYEFTVAALRVSATGRVEDVNNWKTKTYASVFTDVLKTRRPHCPGQLGKELKLTMAEMRVAPEVNSDSEANADTDAEADFAEAEQDEDQMEADIELLKAALRKCMEAAQPSTIIVTQLVLALAAYLRPDVQPRTKMGFGAVLQDIDVPGIHAFWRRIDRQRKAGNFMHGNQRYIQRDPSGRKWIVSPEIKAVAVEVARRILQQ